ncbi:MAG: RagB/SusD family nutrient uptake outer membrane protein [Bacteroidales bacterium]
MKFKIILILGFFTLLSSCVDLDVPPMNMVKDEDIFGNREGIEAYLARVYSTMPMEDFKYSPDRGFNNVDFYGSPSALTGESISRDQNNGTEVFVWWAGGYSTIRDCNYIIQTLPKFANLYSETDCNMWLGEAYFVKATTYFALVKRFGGVPLIDEILASDVDISMITEETLESLMVERASEEKSWDYVGEQFDKSASLLPPSNQDGRANKYAALGLKSRAMLYAGSIAKYNNITLSDDLGNRLCGIPSSEAKRYFEASFNAASEIINNGPYSLYKKLWAAGDREAQYNNFVELFMDKSSSENIFIRKYMLQYNVHQYDNLNLPRQLKGAVGLASQTSPTLDFVENFDGLEKNSDGTLATLDASGNYLMFDSPFDLFSQVEPRLRATVVLPYDEMKGEQIEIRKGIYTGDLSSDIPKFISADSDLEYPTAELLYSKSAEQNLFETQNGQSIFPTGESGVFQDPNKQIGGTLSGFSVRKYIDESLPTSEVGNDRSTQSWIELRLAEVMLNGCEAAYELYAAGEAGTYLSFAHKYINEIRERAGADLLVAEGDLNDIKTIRKERLKELAFENKYYWDLRRWRIYDTEQANRVYRVLMPFYADKAGKYVLDVRRDERVRSYTFDTRWYYNQIPPASINKNSKLIQNPKY